MKTIGTLYDGLFELIPYSLLALLARVIAGLVFFRSGLTKVDLSTFSVKPATFFLFDQEYKFRLFHYLVYRAATPRSRQPIVSPMRQASLSC